MRAGSMAILCLACLALQAQGPAASPVQRVTDSAIAREEVVGRNLADEMLRETTEVNIPAVQGYTERLGEALAGKLPGAGTRFHFQVARFGRCPRPLEPAALPGGFVLVPAELFLTASNEDEFAALLAHGMAHSVLHRRLTPLPKGTSSSGAGLIVGMSACPGDAIVPIALESVLQQQEEEADEVALKTLGLAGFHAEALRSCLERMGASANRQQRALQQRVAALPPTSVTPQEARQSSSAKEFFAAQAAVRQLLDPHGGANVRPSLLRNN